MAISLGKKMVHHKNQNSIRNNHNPRIIILGAGGFIGSALYKNLREKAYKILAPSSKEIDLLDKDSSNKISNLINPDDVVVMLACIPPDRGRDYETFQKNIRMAETLCDALKHKSIGHLIYLSSEAVYSNNIEKVDKYTLASPDTLYGLMHRTREMLLIEFNKSVNLTIIRPTMVIGINDTHNAYGPNRFIRNAYSSNKIVLFGRGEDIKDYIYIDDLVRVIIRLIDERIGGILNVGSGKSYQIAEVAQILSRVMHVENTICYQSRKSPPIRRFVDMQYIMEFIPDFKSMPLEMAFYKMLEELKHNNVHGKV